MRLVNGETLLSISLDRDLLRVGGLLSSRNEVMTQITTAGAQMQQAIGFVDGVVSVVAVREHDATSRFG